MIVTATSADAKPTVLLDPNVISSDGKLAFAGFAPSEDDARIAYGLAIGGGDWHVWRVRDVAADKVVYERPDHPTWQFRPWVTEDGKSLVLEIGDGECARARTTQRCTS